MVARRAPGSGERTTPRCRGDVHLYMPHKSPRATLIHNPKAGGGRHCRSELTEQLSHGGFRVAYFSSKHCDLGEALAQPTDLVVVAGGDGTVAKVARIADPSGPPIAILPLGTANNIATSLGISVAPDEFPAGLRGARIKPFYALAATGPWGRRRLIEGVGFGAFEQAVADMAHKPGIAVARRTVAKHIVSAAPECLRLQLDGETIDRAFAVLELTAIPLVGPNLWLAAAADPSDRRFEICFIGEAPEERQALGRWAAEPDGAGPAPVSLRAAAKATITGQFRRIRLDGHLWPKEPDDEGSTCGPVTIAVEPEPLPFLVPG